MTVHIGEITSEVSAAPGTDAASPTETDQWEERVRIAALVGRLERDRSRTATGYGDD